MGVDAENQIPSQRDSFMEARIIAEVPVSCRGFFVLLACLQQVMTILVLGLQSAVHDARNVAINWYWCFTYGAKLNSVLFSAHVRTLKSS